MREFDYYILIDYSVNLIGYGIIENRTLKEMLHLISKFAHYNEVRNKSSYIHSIKKTIDKNNIHSLFVKYKIREMRDNIEIYLDVLQFLKGHSQCIIFISVDNHEYPNFKKFVNIVDGGKTLVKPESALVLGSPEYKASLVLDTLLNIERLRRDNEQ